MRGIHLLHLPPLHQTGIIPAHAGNTVNDSIVCHDREDHPRSCGEYLREAFRCRAVPGSSPLMRGIRVRKRYRLEKSGIIPAHAGNTVPLYRTGRTCEDHPRSCGEYYVPVRSTSRFTGSSPLMRGILHRKSYPACFSRIIPAHAGNTPVHSHQSSSG